MIRLKAAAFVPGRIELLKEYAVVIERGEKGGYGAYIPDLPGCVAVAKTETEVRKLIREAMELHLKSMPEDGDPIPEPSTQVDYVSLAS